MLKGRLLHPEIIGALAAAGHGSKVLIADSNYPLSTHTNPEALRVYLNLRPGRLNAVEVAAAIAEAIPIEAYEVMQPADGSTPPIFGEFAEQLTEITGAEVHLERLERFAFYDAARQPDVCLAISTGEQRIYANLMLTIGVVFDDAP